MVLLLVLTRQRGPLGPENDLTLPLSDTYVKTMFLAIFMQQDISIYYKMCQILLLKQKVLDWRRPSCLSSGLPPNCTEHYPYLNDEVLHLVPYPVNGVVVALVGGVVLASRPC